jgi:Nitroreductase family
LPVKSLTNQQTKLWKAANLLLCADFIGLLSHRYMNPITQVQSLDVPSAIAQRRSIKTFKSDPISPELLHQLVELTVAAPSSYNIQDWQIVLVQSEAQKAALSAASWNQQQIIQAPVTFVFAADP